MKRLFSMIAALALTTAPSYGQSVQGTWYGLESVDITNEVGGVVTPAGSESGPATLTWTGATLEIGGPFTLTASTADESVGPNFAHGDFANYVSGNFYLGYNSIDPNGFVDTLGAPAFVDMAVSTSFEAGLSGGVQTDSLQFSTIAVPEPSPVVSAMIGIVMAAAFIGVCERRRVIERREL